MVSRTCARGAVRAGLAVWLCAAAFWPAAAEPFKLVPNTKVQITIVQWNLTKGEYEQWGALGGTFVVSMDETLSLPIVGSIDVAGQSGVDIANRIATILKEKVGLLGEPAVTVEVTEYPPIYVVGLVNTPGEYPFRPGMTVLQALALGKGHYRAAVAAGGDSLSLVGELETVRTDILRTLARIARMEAEMGGAAEITFPPELTSYPNEALVKDIMRLEQTVFAARVNEQSRQLENLSALRELYDHEITTWEARAKAGDRSIEMAQKQLDDVSKLYERGVTTLSRQLDLERSLTDLKITRLANDTEMMRSRQQRSETLRKELGIEDERQTSLSLELRDARADLDRLQIRKATLQSLLADDAGALARQDAEQESGPVLVYTITRNVDGKIVSETVSEETFLEPGDVVKIEAQSQSGRATSTTVPTDAGTLAPVAQDTQVQPGKS